ncbi:hypothetical protein DPA00_20490 [Salmonella enterica subsp. enterica]|nr:hypothetical protein [Salmonella enterica]ECU9348761.1 hypothetical protein [Salmonella enterica subsp. enterica serovar Oranienburg]EDO3599627.1 hypothetical protein [Salmonella enterica]MIY13526.1 hypothetical protein [Salmonella enterica subsp. enterica serovar Jangwani]MLK29463.1 hypothetical protein [Salmonella enterica subsp. enterica serovar Jangwani]
MQLLQVRQRGRDLNGVGWVGDCPAPDRSSAARLYWRRAFSSLAVVLGLTLCTTADCSGPFRGPSWPGHPLAVGGGEPVIDTSGIQQTARGLASAGGRVPQRAPSSTIATFRVLETIGGVDNRWTVLGAGQALSLGQGVLWDSRGMVSGYRVVPGGGPVTVTSDTWYRRRSMIVPGQYQSTYVVALYANNNNPGLRPDPTGMITPGYVPDLAAYNAGTGPGWVAVDSSTGNALLLSVRSSVEGTPVVTDQYGNTTGRTLLSPLGARTLDGIVSALAPNDYAFTTTFPGTIASNNPPVVFGCNVPYPNISPNNTCTGGNLRVDITPVVVVRGDVVGVRTSPATGSTLESGAWSPSGTYSLNLSGLVVFA